MTLPRIDRMTEGPIAGRWYMVPTVLATWNMEVKHWPVVGPLHDDEQFFKFPHMHYHVDGRFLTRRQQIAAIGFWGPDSLHERLARVCMGSPLQTNAIGCNPGGLPKPVLMKKKCTIAAILPGHDITEATTQRAMVAHFAGRICKHCKRGFICPHQNVALGAVAVIDGVITCPLHGLRIDAASGLVLA